MFKDIETFFVENNIRKFRFKQFQNAVFKNYITDFSEITSFSKELREKLKDKFQINSLFLIEITQNKDTLKFLFKTKDDFFIESVLMIHENLRRTVCVSSQIFCAVGCKFCATGANSFQRNLKCKEILEQILFIGKYLKNKNEVVTNVVYMGMGEPFLNYTEVEKSLLILNSKEFFNIGARHIVVSTSGIVPKIYKYADLGIQTRLAISLHAPTDKLRSEIMPINKKYDLEKLMEACDYYCKKTKKRISYEYVLIKDINDSLEDARLLVKLLEKRKAHVNLLIFNPHEFSNFQRPNKEIVIKFRDFLLKNNINVSIRKSLGDDISGACGQLSGKKSNKNIKVKFEENEFF